MKINWNSSTIVGGRYQIKRLVGQGGMGAVYEAFDPNLDKTVAIKVLLDPLRQEQSMRFQMEATAAGRLQHPNILSVLDFGITDDNLMYMVTEFVRGESLSARLKRGTLHAEECAYIVSQICKGMQHAHDSNVVHRDLKPANLMLSADGNGDLIVKIVDFGIAKIVDRDGQLTRTGVPLGSPNYMSPEQVTGFSIDHRTDVYSLGCLIFECLEGKPPFKGDSALETMQKRLNHDVPLLSRFERDSALGEGFNELISKCMQKDPDDRFQSMTEVLEYLDDVDTTGSDDKTTTSEWSSRYIFHGKHIEPVKKSSVGMVSVAILVAGAISFFILNNYISSQTPKELRMPGAIVSPFKGGEGAKVDIKLAQIDKRMSKRAEEQEPNLGTLGYQEKIGPFCRLEEQLREGSVWSLDGKSLSGSQLKRLLKSKRTRDLRKIDLSNTYVSNECFEILSAHPLPVLELNNVTFEPNALEILVDAKGLNRLNIEDLPRSEYKSLSKLHNLNELSIIGTHSTSADRPLEPFVLPTNLSYLSFENCEYGISDKMFPNFKPLPRLETLKFIACDFKHGESLKKFSGLPMKLRVLEIRECGVTSFPKISGLSVRRLHLTVPSTIKPDELSPIVNSLKVEVLELVDNRFRLEMEPLVPLFAMAPGLNTIAIGMGKTNSIVLNRSDAPSASRSRKSSASL